MNVTRDGTRRPTYRDIDLNPNQCWVLFHL
jgi:hypothetical protein